MSDQNVPVETPPIEGEDFEPTPTSKWPKVFGIISIVIAILGLLLQTCGVLGVVFNEWAMGLAGLKVEMPPVMKMVAAGSYCVYLVLGILLLMGGISLLQRKPGCLKLLKAWVVLRLIVAALGLGLAFLVLPANIEMQRQINDSMNERLVEVGRPEQPFDEDAIYVRTLLMTGLGLVVTLIYPVVLGLYISRQKITDEVSEWGPGDNWEED